MASSSLDSIFESFSVDDLRCIDEISKLFTKIKVPKRFDAKLVTSRFFKKADENKRTVENEPVPLLRFGNNKIFEHNHASSDLQLFITLFLKYGNNLTKIASKCDEKNAVVIKRKANAYGILMEGDKNANRFDPSYLTLARISEAFALDTVNIILRKQIPGKLISGSKLFLSPLPILLQHTIFPAVIPHHTYTKEFKDIAVILNIDFMILFCAPENKFSQQSKRLSLLLHSSEEHVDEIMKRSILDENVKVEKMVEAGLLELVQNGSERESQKKYKPTAVALKLINELQIIKKLELRRYNEAVYWIHAK